MTVRAVHASEFLDYGRLPGLVAEGLLSRREHPSQPLFIYNYTPACQYGRKWDRETLACRGLILDAEGYVYARPFGKFFNLDERIEGLPPLPIGEPFEAFEKLDGSLGIAYRELDFGEVRIATRGAFASEQAEWANRWWRDCGDDDLIQPGQTWLFEVIYPDNRIVVDYGQRAELVLLAVMDNATGRDLPLPTWHGTTARRFHAADVDALTAQVTDPANFEGFVLRYPSTGQRVKVKLDEYVRLHKLITQCTPRTIWEELSSGRGLQAMLERVPDEFYSWVTATAEEMQAAHGSILATCREDVCALAVPGDRKATALRFKERPYPAVLFKMLDGKDPDQLIWKELYPAAAKPFKIVHETAA